MKWTDYATRKDFENRDLHQKRNGIEQTGTLISDAPGPRLSVGADRGQ